MWFMFVVPFIIFFIVFTFIVRSFIRSHKSTDIIIRQTGSTISAFAEEKIENVIEKPKEETKVCEYCGSVVANNSVKCNSCGAKVKK